MKLKERFGKLNICKGMRYVEILQRVEAAPRITDRNANGDTERTWAEERYSITLTFDHQDICFGVQEERLDKENFE